MHERRVNAAHYDGQEQGRLDVVRRLRKMADDSILSPAGLPARAAMLRACDTLEREIRKAGG